LNSIIAYLVVSLPTNENTMHDSLKSIYFEALIVK